MRQTYTYWVPAYGCGGGTTLAASGGGPGLPPPLPDPPCTYVLVVNTTYYVYSGGGLVAEYYSTSASGSPDGAYLALFYDPARLMKTVYRATNGSLDTRYQHLDYKGSLRGQSSESGLPIGGENIYYP